MDVAVVPEHEEHRRRPEWHLEFEVDAVELERGRRTVKPGKQRDGEARRIDALPEPSEVERQSEGGDGLHYLVADVKVLRRLEPAEPRRSERIVESIDCAVDLRPAHPPIVERRRGADPCRGRLG